MPKYELAVYELTRRIYHVEAMDRADAVIQHSAGKSEPVGDAEFEMVDNDRGLSRNEDPDLYEAVRDRAPDCVDLDAEFIAGIEWVAPLRDPA